ncbi:hypothetical protein XENOCAPTIV_010351, partial [Xenoophorus captivus]
DSRRKRGVSPVFHHSSWQSNASVQYCSGKSDFSLDFDGRGVSPEVTGHYRGLQSHRAALQADDAAGEPTGKLKTGRVLIGNVSRRNL